jgi:hypothetical protein
MATDIVQTLFGITPEGYQRQQDALLDARALKFAELDPMAQATYGIYRGAGQLGGALGRALGASDPQLELISFRQSVARGLDPTNPESIKAGIEALRPRDPQGAMMLAQEYRNSLLNAQTLRKTTAEANRAELSLTQEAKLREELGNLGATPTQDQILAVVSKYGPPDKILTALQASSDREAARVARAEELEKDRLAKIEAARVLAEGRLREAELRGADARELERIRVQGRKEIAELVAAMKGPSAAVLKAQEKAEKLAEGQAALSDTLSTAKTLIADLAKMGGITSTSKGPLANLITSAQTGSIGQMVGRAVGTEAQAKRDELKSIRLQLLNAVKEATGMSAQQLNSNVELQTYLNSLGSEGMTKEANEAILENLSRRYLRKGAAMPPPAPGGGVDTKNPLLN